MVRSYLTVSLVVRTALKLLLLGLFVFANSAFSEAALTVKRGTQADDVRLYLNVVGGSGNCTPGFGGAGYPSLADGVRSTWLNGGTAYSNAASPRNLGDRILAAPGTYTFRCTHTTNGSVGSDTLTVTGCLASETWNGSDCVSNTPPTANAGTNVPITLPISSANTSGATASDAEGPVSILWTNTARPGGAPVPGITSGTTISPTFTGMTVAGTYTFNLRVTDSAGVVANDSMNVVVSSAPIFSCTGTLPGFASYHAGDTTGLAANTPSTYSLTNTAPKCQYVCNTAYWWNGGSCVLPDLTAQNSSPAVGATFDTSTAITFTGSAVNSATAPVAQGGWADLEIDVDGDGIRDFNYNAFGGVQLGSFTQGQSKVLTRTLAAGTLSAGSYRYRFHVDTNGAGVVESNESNNTAPWRNFTVTAIPLPSASITVTGCTIPVGGVNCPANVAWNSDNVAAVSVRQNSVQFSTLLDNPSGTSRLLGAGSFTFSVVNTSGGATLASQTITISCAVGSGWDGTSCDADNVPPLANAGSDVNIELPTNFANTSGVSASDPDGTYTVLWTNTVRPGGAPLPGITDAATLSPTFTNLVTAGTYTFNLRVTDNEGAIVNDTMNVVVAPAPPAVCTGTLPFYSTIYPGDTTGFFGNLPLVYSAANTATKCEFSCNASYNWNGSACVQPDLSAVSTGPANGATFLANETITFTGSAVNSNVTTIAQGGWAGVEIDWNSDGAAIQYLDANNGNQLGAFAISQSKPLQRVYAAPVPAGTHRYRFNVDSTGSFGESNETNNRSAWRTFTVSIPAPTPPTAFELNPAGLPAACGGRVNLRWTASSNGYAEWYEYSVNGGGWVNVGNNTTVTVSSLTPNISYSFRVRAQNSVSGPSTPAGPLSTNASDYCRDLSVSSCTIPLNGNTCTGNVSWDITGAGSPNIFNDTTDDVLGGSNVASSTARPITLERSTAYGNEATGQNVIQARDGTTVLAFRTPIASCGAGNFFNSSEDECREEPEVTINPDTTYIREGETATINFSVEANYAVVCTVTGGMPVTTINHDGTPAIQPHTVVTNPLTSAQIVRVSCTAPGLPSPVIEEGRVNVLAPQQET